QDINDTLDFFKQSIRWSARDPKPAGAVNTLGDVPDSEWFTNRHGLRRMSRSQLQQGPESGGGPVLPFKVIRGKTEGIMLGFTVEDSRGRRYFVKGDPRTNPELASAPESIVSRFLYAIGYNTPQNDVVDVKLSDLHLSSTAKIDLPDHKHRKM